MGFYCIWPLIVKDLRIFKSLYNVFKITWCTGFAKTKSGLNVFDQAPAWKSIRLRLISFLRPKKKFPVSRHKLDLKASLGRVLPTFFKLSFLVHQVPCFCHCEVLLAPKFFAHWKQQFQSVFQTFSSVIKKHDTNSYLYSAKDSFLIIPGCTPLFDCHHTAWQKLTWVRDNWGTG